MTAPLLPLDVDALEGTFTPMTSLAEDPVDAAPLLADVDTVFDPKFREDFIGLLFLGVQEKTVRLAGHTFLLKTPGQSDRLAMGEIQRPWANTVQGEYAWRLVTVAAFLHAIDGEEAAVPLKPAPGEGLRTRFKWVQEAIASDIVIGMLYEQCLLLENESRLLIQQLDSLGEA